MGARRAAGEKGIQCESGAVLATVTRIAAAGEFSSHSDVE